MSDFDMISAMQKLLLEAEPPQDYFTVFPSDKAMRLLKEHEAMEERLRELEQAAASVLAHDWPGISEEAAAALNELSEALEPPR